MHDLPAGICIAPIDPKLFRGYYTVAGCPAHWVDEHGFLTGLLDALPKLIEEHNLDRTLGGQPPILHGYWVDRRRAGEAASSAGMSFTNGPRTLALREVQPFRASLGKVEQSTDNGTVEIQNHALYVRDRHGTTVEGWDRMVDRSGKTHWVKVMESKVCYPTPSPQFAPSQRRLLWKRLGRFLASRWGLLPDPKPSWDEVAADTGMESRPSRTLTNLNTTEGEAFLCAMSRPSIQREWEMYCEIMSHPDLNIAVIGQYVALIRTMVYQLIDQYKAELTQKRRDGRAQKRPERR